MGGGTQALAQYMNDPTKVPKIKATKSSFDWSSVKLTFRPDTSIKLPPPPLNRPRIQHVFKKEQRDVEEVQERRREEIKRVFKKAWKNYKERAWMADAIKPLSGEPVQQFSGWSATLVDSLDTLWILGLRDEFYEAVKAVATIDFGNSTSNTVNMFESCIRYLGGLIAAYDLSGQEALKIKAKEIGDLLYAGFNTKNRMPVDMIPFEAAKTGLGLTVESNVVSASPGTITLEFSRLSQITGDSKYYSAVSKVMDVFYENQNKTRLPGMWPMYVSMSEPDVTAGYQFTIGGNADSMYEYLPKAHALLGSGALSSAKYEIMARTFMDTAMENLFFYPMIPGKEDVMISGNVDVLETGEETGEFVPRLDPESEHLSCFIGGLYALGGRLFENTDYVDVGGKLARGCMYAYDSFQTKIMPERYNMVLCPDRKKKCKWDDDLWVEERRKRPQWKEHLPKGFTTAKDPRYILRPEAIESVFVLWRVTGEERYREAAWQMFQAVVNATDTVYGNAPIEDVSIKGTKQTDDNMEVSFPSRATGQQGRMEALIFR